MKRPREGFDAAKARLSRLPDMDGTPTMKAVAAAALALLALGGTFGPALAEDDAGIATPRRREDAADLPRFVPSAEARRRRVRRRVRAVRRPAIEPVRRAAADSRQRSTAASPAGTAPVSPAAAPRAASASTRPSTPPRTAPCRSAARSA